MKKVVGYIILNEEGNYLAGELFWYGHKKPEDAFVHPSGSLDEISKELSAARSELLPGDIWFAPKTRVPAIWSPEGGVIITGEPESFPWMYN